MNYKSIHKSTSRRYFKLSSYKTLTHEAVTNTSFVNIFILFQEISINISVLTVILHHIFIGQNEN